MAAHAVALTVRFEMGSGETIEIPATNPFRGIDWRALVLEELLVGLEMRLGVSGVGDRFAGATAGIRLAQALWVERITVIVTFQVSFASRKLLPVSRPGTRQSPWSVWDYGGLKAVPVVVVIRDVRQYVTDPLLPNELMAALQETQRELHSVVVRAKIAAGFRADLNASDQLIPTKLPFPITP